MSICQKCKKEIKSKGFIVSHYAFYHMNCFNRLSKNRLADVRRG